MGLAPVFLCGDPLGCVVPPLYNGVVSLNCGLGKSAEAMTGLYDGMAVSEYDPMDLQNDYTISGPNEYYLRLMSQPHDGWFMGEDGNG